MKHYRVEFRLSMPGRSSWNGGWSGEGKNYSVVRELTGEQIARLFFVPFVPELLSATGRVTIEPSGHAQGQETDLSRCKNSWTHRWSDGWAAQVSARVVPAGEKLPKSDGFNGYEWMIDNILRNGNPYGEVTS